MHSKTFLTQFQTLTKAYCHLVLMHESYSCTKCIFKTTGHPRMLMHIKYAHKNDDEPVTRNIFNLRDKLVYRKYGSCHFCGHSPHNIENLRKHMRVVHHIGMVPAECKDCGKWFRCKGHLESHIAYHHKGRTDKLKERVCPHENCDYTTKFIHNYTRHLRSHGDTMLECPSEGCGFTISSGLMLSRHIAKEHKEAAAKLKRSMKLEVSVRRMLMYGHVRKKME